MGRPQGLGGCSGGAAGDAFAGAGDAQLRIDTGIEIYFCDLESPWAAGH